MASQLLTGRRIGLRFAMRCWGPFALTDATSGADLKPRGRKARATMAYLAMHPGRQIGRDRLCGLLWGDRAEEQARASLRQTLFELRGFSRGETPLIRIDRDGVMLAMAALTTDIDEIRDHAVAGRFEALLAALPEPDEPLFANLGDVDQGFDEWLRIERTRQGDALEMLVADASALAVASGHTRAARALHARLGELTADTPGAAPPPRAAVATASPEAEPIAGDAPAAALAAAPAEAPPGRGMRWWPAAAGLALAAGLLPLAYFQSPPPARPAQAADQREAASLYAAAREMMRAREPGKLRAASDLLRRAIALEPGFAPAWAALAAVTGMQATDAAGLAEAERHARHALALDPGSADAHAALGMVLGFHGPEARAHLEKAAALKPGDPEIQFWLSNVYANDAEYGKQLDALRRSVALDPLWPRSVNVAALAAWEMGYRDEALRYARRLTKVDPQAAFVCDYQLDLAAGDYSGIVRKIAAARPALVKGIEADAKLGFALVTLGDLGPARLLLRIPEDLWALVRGGAPSPDRVRSIYARAETDWPASQLMPALRRELLNAGRAAELVALYDSGQGVIGDLRDPSTDNAPIVDGAPDIAIALRAVGRGPEAEALLTRAGTIVDRSEAAGRVPYWFDALAAQLHAVRGRRDQAIAALSTAIDRGWHYAPLTANPDIETLPAFRLLRGDPRFESLRTRLLNQLARERKALGPVRL